MSVMKTLPKPIFKPMLKGMHMRAEQSIELCTELEPCTHLQEHVKMHVHGSIMFISASVQVCLTLAPSGLFEAIQDSGSLLSGSQMLLSVT